MPKMRKSIKTLNKEASTLGNLIFSRKFARGKNNIDNKIEKYKGTIIAWHCTIINAISTIKSNLKQRRTLYGHCLLSNPSVVKNFKLLHLKVKESIVIHYPNKI